MLHSRDRARRISVRIAVLSIPLALVCAAHPILLGAPPREVNDRGVFVVSQAGRPIGTETFAIKSSSHQVEAEAKIELRVEQDGKSFEFRTSPKLVMNSDFEPLTYSWSQKSAQSSELSVDFRSTPAKAHYRTVTGQADEREFELPKDVVILDSNVFHHYQLVIQRYRRTPGGKQAFHAFIPQEALPGSLNVEDVGKEQVEVGGEKRNLRHLVITTDLARIDLWADSQDRVERVSIPAAGIEAVRKPQQ
ncbi:MAG: hypothetical protein LAO07_17530 [Acidobacteriia bacterium]|nr:hypothetical protein [Terriglobia bacterium]